MNTRGRHLLLELRGCEPSLLDDLSTVRELMERAATAVRATIIDSVFHEWMLLERDLQHACGDIAIADHSRAQGPTSELTMRVAGA